VKLHSVVPLQHNDRQVTLPCACVRVSACVRVCEGACVCEGECVWGATDYVMSQRC